jgi:signal transduction histidine kinase
MLLGEDISARRQRDQARAEAIGFVTHELRTPLIAIQGFAEVLMRYPRQAAGSEAPTTIFRESRRLVAMINAYLEVLRMDVGSRPLRIKPVEITEMVHHVEQILQPLAQSAQIAIYTDVTPQARTLNCDEPLVAGALLNLLSNAVKYSPRGSKVTLQVLVRNDQVEFQVRNPGPVIPPEGLERIFEPYYRVPDLTGDKQGWGLGLAFVKRISEQHGGGVQVSSSAHAGTCFCLTLPLQANMASEAVV